MKPYLLIKSTKSKTYFKVSYFSPALPVEEDRLIYLKESNFLFIFEAGNRPFVVGKCIHFMDFVSINLFTNLYRHFYNPLKIEYDIKNLQL